MKSDLVKFKNMMKKSYMPSMLLNPLRTSLPCRQCLLNNRTLIGNMVGYRQFQQWQISSYTKYGVEPTEKLPRLLSRRHHTIMDVNDIKKRHFGVGFTARGVNIRPHIITSRLAAEQLVRDMSEEERKRVQSVLEDLEQELLLEKGTTEKVPSWNQLRMLAFVNSIPFIGFGFFDNAIMILAGEYIDYTVGAAFGITTMAAAAIGNMISDVAGIGLAGWVEALACRLGLEEPTLTPLQMTMTESRIACHFGRAIGIVIGCIIGMAPLLIISSPREDQCHGVEHAQSE